MKINVTHDIDDLANDLTAIARRVRPDMREVVRDGIRAGNELAKGCAKTKNPAGSHSRKYPGTFSAEMYRNLGLFGNTISGEYGPRHQGQGMLAGILEDGRPGAHNAPQNNLRKSADLIGPQLLNEVDARVKDWFW